MLLILDIDGTLADISHREYLVEQATPDWDEFFDPELVFEDDPIEEAQDVLLDTNIFKNVIFITGRPESLRDVTVEWLDKYFDYRPSEQELFMRPEGSTIPSERLKEKVLEEVIELYGDEEDWYFIDDEDANVEMFNEFGTALKAPGCWKYIKEAIYGE